MLVIWGSTGTPKGTAWDPGLDFHRFLVDLGNLLGVVFYQFAVFFLGTRLSILSVGSEVCILMGLGEKMVPGSVVGCVENIANTVVS